MSSRNARLFAVAALVLWIVLAPSAALASPRTPGEQAGGWLARLWSELTSLWSKDGCQILPDGRVYCPTEPPPSAEPQRHENRPNAKAAVACAAPVLGALQATPTPGRR